ncbi:hypothetical protein D3C85_868790 [compost metagenome]
MVPGALTIMFQHRAEQRRVPGRQDSPFIQFGVFLDLVDIVVDPYPLFTVGIIDSVLTVRRQLVLPAHVLRIRQQVGMP